jgi:hypothetical protein
LLTWIVLIHLFALGLVLFSPLSVFRLVVLGLFISAGFCFSYLRWHRPRWIGVGYRDGAWTLAGERGEEAAELLGYQLLFGMLLMRFSVGRSGQRLLLLPDSVDPHSVRKLRQLLILAQA